MYATTASARRAPGEPVGALGNDWFAGRVWIFDYPHQSVSYYESAPSVHPMDAHTIPMTTKGKLHMNHPRINVVIDGDSVDVLLDTGASSTFEANALTDVPAGPATRASAFVTARLFDKWRTKHPEWRFVQHGEAFTAADIIEVPDIRIAGFDVGPIWFAKRPNSVYDGMMAQVMDKPIAASIGGSALRTFRITLDYPNQRATFTR
jgi:hypothetical protein